MTPDEARCLIDSIVLWNPDGGGPLEVRIVNVREGRALIRGAGLNLVGKTARPRSVPLGELTPVPYRELAAAAQAELNEFAFSVMMDTHWDYPPDGRRHRCALQPQLACRIPV